MRYAASIPDAEGARPLVIALHYAGEVTPGYGEGVLTGLFEPALRALGPVVVAPDCPGRGWADPVSEAAVLSLLERALVTLPVDPERVVIAGYSLGGFGAWYLAARHPDRFSAALPVAGWPYDPGSIRVPLFAVHSQRDEIVPYAHTAAAVEALVADGHEARLVTVERLTHYQVPRHARWLTQSVPWLEKIWGYGGDRE